MAGLEIQYATTVDDYVAYGRYTLQKSKVARRSRLFAWIVPALGCLGGAVALVAVGLPALAVPAAVAGAVYAGIYPIAYRRHVDNYLRSYAQDAGMRGVVGPIRLILDDHKLVEVTERTRTEAQWKTMSGVVEVGDHTFIMVTDLAAAILPRHAFANDEEYHRVRDFARARVGQGDGSSIAGEF